MRYRHNQIVGWRHHHPQKAIRPFRIKRFPPDKLSSPLPGDARPENRCALEPITFRLSLLPNSTMVKLLLQSRSNACVLLGLIVPTLRCLTRLVPEKRISVTQRGAGEMNPPLEWPVQLHYQKDGTR